MRRTRVHVLAPGCEAAVPDGVKAHLGTSHQFHGTQPVLPVRNVARSAEHYRDVLGFEIDLLSSSHHGMSRGDSASS